MRTFVTVELKKGHMGKIDKIMIVGFVAAIIVLLLGHRFNASWAGGTGYLVQNSATPYLPRGQSASTTDAFAVYSLNNSQIFLDKSTTVTLLDGRAGFTSWRVDTGRVVVNGLADLHVRNLTVHIDGQATLVHYSWLDRIDVLLINGSGSVNGQPLTLNQAVTISTTATSTNYLLLTTNFSLTTPSVKPFYDWVLSTERNTKPQ